MQDGYHWWQTEIVYQIYPRSFQDSNGDGIGDLPGIHRRLDYLQSLNIGAIWISPIYPSPMADFGYDVADYTGIAPDFGTMADFDQLLAATHARGLKLILDLVPNHTSDLHPWFVESRSSRDNPKRDWYIWRDPAPGGGPPNNWISHFGGPAWTLDPASGQYYLHQFLPEQPELNYRNPDVLAAMLAVIRFWLDKGVDGFRVDVIALLAKDEEFRDQPPNPDYRPGMSRSASQLGIYTVDVSRVHDYIREFRKVLDQYDERVLIGETYLPYERLVNYYGSNLDECHLPFNFHLLDTAWQVEMVRKEIEEYETHIPPGAWPNWVLGNHDRPRVASRLGPGQERVGQMLLLTLRGTPTCYYGDELGMTNVVIAPERLQDRGAINQPERPDANRDPERTPMQWDASANAGFSPPGVEPWLPLSNDYGVQNVAAETADPRSVLSFFRRLTALRGTTPALSVGSYRSIETGNPDVLGYARVHAQARLLVLLNFSQAAQSLELGAVAASGRTLLSTEMDREGRENLQTLLLRPNEGIIVQW